MAVATSTLLIAGISAVSAISQGIAAKKQAEANAAIYKKQAAISQAQTDIEQFKQQEQVRRFKRQASAQIGLNSSSISGSYLQNLNESFTAAALDAGAIEFSGALQQSNYLTAAANEKAKGQAAFTQGLIGAGSSLLTGYGKSLQV